MILTILLTCFATLLYTCCSCPFLKENSAQSENFIHANGKWFNSKTIAINAIITLPVVADEKKTLRRPPTAPATSPTTLLPARSMCLKTKYAEALVTPEGTCSAYEQIRKDFMALLPAGGTPDEDFTRSNIFGKALRLAFHDAGEIDITQPDRLGPDGCLSNTTGNEMLLYSPTIFFSNKIFAVIICRECGSDSLRVHHHHFGGLALRTHLPEVLRLD
jgi:hypothetical protein